MPINFFKANGLNTAAPEAGSIGESNGFGPPIHERNEGS